MFAENFIDLKLTDLSLGGGTFMAVFGIFDCVLLCLNTKNCSSFSYSPAMRTCRLSPRRYKNTTKLIPQAGIKYYIIGKEFGMECVSSAECFYKNSVCRQGSCRCAVGYSYQPSNSICVMRCTAYGDDFAVYRHHGIFGCNRGRVKNSTGESCMEACLKETKFVCISAEYHEIKANGFNCNLCNKAWFDIPKSKRDQNSFGWILFQRHCSN